MIPALLWADGVHLSEWKRSIFSHRLAKLVKRALDGSCWRKETSVCSTPTSLIPGPARDAQSLERDPRSAGEHVKSSTKESQLLKPVSWLHPSSRTYFKYLRANAFSMENKLNGVWNLCMPAGLWPYQLQRWVLWLGVGMEWSRLFGKAGKGDKQRMLPALSVTNWSAWSSAWWSMESQLQAYRSRSKGRQVPLQRGSEQEDQVDEALCRQIGAASRSQALVHMCWRATQLLKGQHNGRVLWDEDLHREEGPKKSA